MPICVCTCIKVLLIMYLHGNILSKDNLGFTPSFILCHCDHHSSKDNPVSMLIATPLKDRNILIHAMAPLF